MLLTGCEAQQKGRFEGQRLSVSFLRIAQIGRLSISLCAVVALTRCSRSSEQLKEVCVHGASGEGSP